MKSFFLSAVLSRAAAVEPFQHHKLSLDSLNTQDAGSLRHLEDAMTSVGLFGVTNIPGFDSLKRDVLASSAQCSRDSAAAVQYVFEDGTVRRTMASSTVQGTYADVDAIDASVPSCQQFLELEREFREVVDEVTASFVDAMDQIQGTDASLMPLMRTRGGRNFKTFKDLQRGGSHLEHFHSYHKPANQDSDEMTLELHTDHGLFIALTPAMMLEGSAEDHGFYIQLEDGSVVEPQFGDELVFMAGDGMRNWVNDKLKKPLRATPHAMTMRGGDGVRSWFGKMFLPHPDAVLGGDETFLEQKERIATSQGKATVCSDGPSGYTARRFLQSNGDCSAGSLYCWHQCQQVIECDEGLESVCVSGSGDNAVPSTGHSTSQQCFAAGHLYS